MGFFSSDQEIDQTTDTYNKYLDSYTQGYRGAAPWGFATLDPTATLLAMGKGTKVGGKNLGQDTKDMLQGLSADEKKQRQSVNDTLDRITQRQKSGQFLTPQETEFINSSLDKAYEYAHKTGYVDWEKGAQSLAGRMGLRTSDTPVAQPAMNALRDFDLGLGSQRAQAGLDATMKFAANQQAFDESFASTQQSLMQQTWATRMSNLFGGGLSGAGNIGMTTHNKGTFTTNPSGFQQFMGGLQMANGVLDLGTKAANGFGGMPGGLS